MILKRVSPTLLKSRLRAGVIQFAFKKLDGTLRTAVGTTDLTRVPTESHPSGEKPASPKVVTFWDMEKLSWRCVSITQEIFMEELPLPPQ